MATEKRDWWQTVRQSAPDVGRVLRNLAPTFDLDRLERIDPAFLDEHFMRGIIWDVDGTLTSYHGKQPAASARAILDRFAPRPDIRQVILSNCGEDRYLELGRMFPTMAILKAYGDGERIAYRRLLGENESWEGAARQDDMRSIRKPNAHLIEFAVKSLGLRPDEVLMVGDQYWTDVAGANMAGVRSARVPTLERQTFPATLRALQAIEGVIRRVFG